MKLVISERQLNKIITQLNLNKEITEEGGEGAPEAGTSSDGEQKTGASKWESGVTRGPANQIAVTKWADSYKITRGRANPLSEQDGSQNVRILRPDGKIMLAPQGTKILSVFDQSKMDGSAFKNSLKNYISKANGGLGNSETQKWVPLDWSKIITLNSVSSFTTPDGEKYVAIIKHPKITAISKKGGGWDQVYQITPDPNGWRFYAYISDSKKVFAGLEEEKSFWDEWKYWILTGASVLAVILVPGIGGLIVSIGIDLFSAALQYSEGDTIGAGVSVLLAFVPVLGKYIKGLKVAPEVAEGIAKKLAPLKTEKEIIDMVTSLPQQERYFMQKLLSEDPKKLTALIEKELFNNVTTNNVDDVVGKLNKLIKEKTLSKVKAESIFKSLGLKRFGFDFGVSGVIGLAGGGLKYYLAQVNKIEASDIPIDQKQIEIGQLIDEIYNKNPEDYETKIYPVLNKYSSYNTGGDEEIRKLVNIQIAVIKAYSENSNKDLFKVAEEANK
jgi:hypothetical protein